MFSRFLAAQRAAHHNQSISVLPVRRQCLTTSSESSSSSNWWGWYSKKLETHPLLTKGLTSGFISGTGDAICQYLSDDHPWDLWRTTRFVIMGAIWVAPMTHVWYDALSTRLIPGGKCYSKVFQRLLLDQFGFAPLFVPSFMAGLWLLEGRNNILEQLEEVAPSVIEANWALWIPAQIVNFSVVPLNYQVLFGNVVALLWNVYLSWVNANTAGGGQQPHGMDGMPTAPESGVQ